MVITGGLTCDGVIGGSIGTGYINVDEIRAFRESIITVQENVVINGSLVVNGSITAYNSNPFWIAGKVNSNGVVQSSKGRYTYTCTRNGNGLYTITPAATSPFDNTYYIVNLTCQVEGAYTSARVVNSSLSVSSFQVLTYVNAVLLD